MSVFKDATGWHGDNRYDQMLVTKENNKDKLLELRIDKPAITNKQLARKLKVTPRTISRYQSELRQEDRLL